MGFRCELCDEWLPMLSFCKLCDKCYKIRTITKCYDAEKILNHLQEHFLVSHAREEEEKKLDEKFFKEEEERIRLEFENDLKQLAEKKLETIKEETETETEKPKSPEIYETKADEKPIVETRSQKKKHYKNINSSKSKTI